MKKELIINGLKFKIDTENIAGFHFELGGKDMNYGKIKKLERNIEGHSYTSFEVGDKISEILDITSYTKLGYLYREYEIRYKNGEVKELIGGIFTVTRFRST